MRQPCGGRVAMHEEVSYLHATDSSRPGPCPARSVDAFDPRSAGPGISCAAPGRRERGLHRGTGFMHVLNCAASAGGRGINNLAAARRTLQRARLAARALEHSAQSDNARPSLTSAVNIGLHRSEEPRCPWTGRQYLAALSRDSRSHRNSSRPHCKANRHPANDVVSTPGDVNASPAPPIQCP
jgi:hypothetical protein